jgi:Mn-dependent DtxR family transcriptional regulator
MVCLVNYLYNGIAEGSLVDLVTVSQYAKELKVKGLVKLHGKEQFQVEILEKKKVEEQLQKLQSHECDSDSSSDEDEDLQIIYENVQESLPIKTNDSSSEINSKRKRQISQCSTHTEKKIILEPIPGKKIQFYYQSI